jgi:hypothetical protein
VIGDEARARGIEPAAILQLVLCVEAEEVGRALRAIGSRHILGRIDHVGKGEGVLGGERLHVVEGVLAIGAGFVGHDRDRANADLAQRIRFGDEAVDHRAHVGAMVADEGNERALVPAHVGKPIGFSVPPWSAKSRAFQPKSQMPVLVSTITISTPVSA